MLRRSTLTQNKMEFTYQPDSSASSDTEFGSNELPDLPEVPQAVSSPVKGKSTVPAIKFGNISPISIRDSNESVPEDSQELQGEVTEVDFPKNPEIPLHTSSPGI